MSAPSALTHPMGPWLRARVIALRSHTRARNFPGTVELLPPDADPGSDPVASWTYGTEPTDHGLRVDVLVRLLTGSAAAGVPRVSLAHVRPGRHEPTDTDLGWAGASRIAAAISGNDVATVVIVSRWGWLDLVSGAQRSWVRLRPTQAVPR